ncbi:MAG: diaminopimelate decarboxylase [Oscillospiraceae bacterium]|nr:diaminopimelate decarboxylase [Oscillospiraceae bacterium]
MICENISVNEAGILCFAGQSTLSLAQQYGTPLYLMDEDRIRNRMRVYADGMQKAFGEYGHVLYASKAASFKRLYEIAAEEQIGVDVVSAGEIASALRAGYPMAQACFHSNNKTDEDINYAIANGVGLFVVDNTEELYAIDAIAREYGRIQPLLLRITPGIDPHTYAAVNTGMVDSKFGSAIETGQAEEITRLALSLSNIELQGFHCHVGSQVFDSQVYLQTADIMLAFVADMYHKLGFVTKKLDLGGGYGVRYVAGDPDIDIESNILSVGVRVRELVAQYGIEMPHIYMEPGRSIVADAGMTLYTMGTLKRIPGYKNYVSVDGGMADNPRYILYEAPYTLLPASQMHAPRNMVCSVVGRCCESGDVLQDNVRMPDTLKRGDLIACLTTGAYNYSMASNYNRIPRPAVVMLRGGSSYVAVKRETVDDITRLDV